MAKCSNVQCDSTDTDVYKYPTYDDEPETTIIFCPECASKDGFCPCCGWFVAGSGDENWNGTGLCYECCQRLDDEIFYEDY